MTEVGISTSTQKPISQNFSLFGRGIQAKRFFEQLLLAQIWISPPDNWSKEAIPLEEAVNLK